MAQLQPMRDQPVDNCEAAVAWLPQVRVGGKKRRISLFPGLAALAKTVATNSPGAFSEALANAPMRPGYRHRRSLFFMVIFPYSTP